MSITPFTDFYTQHSCFSDPEQHVHLFDDLPDDLDALCRVVRGLYVHYRSDAITEEMKPRLGDIDTRYVSRMLGRLMDLDAAKLTVQRPVEKRFIGCCRDASMLLCAMLRHKGIPARIRIGFATYIHTDSQFPYVDHVVTEYWDVNAERWKLIDAEQSEKSIEHNQITFDVHDIPRDKFLIGGKAWQIGRADAQRWDDFGVNDFVKGRWFVADYLLYDLAALNRHEMLLWEIWGLMKKGDELDDADLALLDKLADLCINSHESYETIRELYQADSRLRVSKTVMNYSPAAKPTEVTLDCADITS